MAERINSIGPGTQASARFGGTNGPGRKNAAASTGPSPARRTAPAPPVRTAAAAAKAESTSRLAESTAVRSKEPAEKERPATKAAAAGVVKRFVLERDDVSGMTVIRFMDSKGNVIIQVPPDQYLKTLQLLHLNEGAGAQGAAGENGSTGLTGRLVNKKV